MEAIGDEPSDMLQLPFVEITQSPPPEPFTHLWLSDVSQYAESYPQILNGVLS